MPTFSAACLAIGVTIVIFAQVSIRAHWFAPGPVWRRGPWPYTKVAGVISGLFIGLGLCSWLL